MADKGEKGIIWRGKKQAYLLTLIDDEYSIDDERESVLNVAASGHYQDK